MKAFLAALVLALAAPAACREAPPEAKPELYLITSLPLLFAEQFSLDAKQPPVVAALERDYRLTAIDLPSQLPPGALLLAIQPRALPAEELVALDAWVRGGGRLLLLADPRLEWPSERPLGDRLRPPPMFADTGLLGHWGLRLEAPDGDSPVSADGVIFPSPGRFVETGGPCAVDKLGLVARCRIGQGQATVVADADWLSDEPATADAPPFETNMKRLDSLLDSLRG